MGHNSTAIQRILNKEVGDLFDAPRLSYREMKRRIRDLMAPTGIRATFEPEEEDQTAVFLDLKYVTAGYTYDFILFEIQKHLRELYGCGDALDRLNSDKTCTS